jgi:hypothetical protein
MRPVGWAKAERSDAVPTIMPPVKQWWARPPSLRFGGLSPPYDYGMGAHAHEQKI